MNRKTNRILGITTLAIALAVLALSCKKDNDPNIKSITFEREYFQYTPTAVTVSGVYAYDGKIDGIKMQVGQRKDLADALAFDADIDGKDYTVEITGLQPGTEYHYCYEVDYGFSKPYKTETKAFATPADSPVVKTVEVMPLDSTTVRVKCEVVAEGGQEVTERGICWNTYGDPTLDDETMQHAAGGVGQYTLRMEGLALSTRYYVRAYAKNASGIGFGEVLEFRTGGETAKPQVSTVEVSDVTYNAATCLCNVSSDGGLELYERGVCWGLELNPILKVPAEGTEIGNYTVTIEGLNLNTDYHVRAYAINEKGIAYGEDLPFRTTDGKPTVTTSGIIEITSTSAKCVGEVTDQGANPVTERGICWSTSHEPMATGNHVANGMGTGSFICDMTNLTPNQTYYVRAYATNEIGTAYGDEVDFMAMEGLPSVETLDVTNVTTSSAKVNYKVTLEGGLEVDEHGICWSESNTIPTINDHYVSGGNGTGTFSIDLIGLNPGTRYYVRAYAKNEQGGEAYGSAKEFATEATLPTVTTDGIEGTTAHGTVTADGGATVTERGICWGLNHNPTTSGSHANSGTGTGSFTVNMTGLTANTTYYVRAYAVNSAGTSYGSEVPFTTLPSDGTHAYVDLGLPSGLLWATCNIGADLPEDYGVYFAWGETQHKSYYSWSTYHYCMGSSNTLTKYCSKASYGYNGYTDNFTVLEASDDVATAQWGNGWRMPTKEEWQELYQNTTRLWTTQNGVNGRLFIATNGNSLFLPAAGYRDEASLDGAGSYGYYWSSSLNTDNPDNAWNHYFSSGSCGVYDNSRYYGRSVRPVRSVSKN